MGQELWPGLQGLHLCPVPSNSMCTCYSLQGICFCSEKWWTDLVCRLIWLCQHLSWKAWRGLLVTNQLFLPSLRQMSGAFCSPVASLQSKRVSEAVLSLLLVGSARGLLCLHSQVYIFVRRLCRASFYSVLSSARYLLMHAFLSFAASKTADKTRSSSVSIWEGLFETQSNCDPLALICPDHAVSVSASLAFAFTLHLLWSRCDPETSVPLIKWLDFLLLSEVKLLQWSHCCFLPDISQPFKVPTLYVTNKCWAQSIPKVIQGTGCTAHVVKLCGLSALLVPISSLCLLC